MLREGVIGHHLHSRDDSPGLQGLRQGEHSVCWRVELDVRLAQQPGGERPAEHDDDGGGAEVTSLQPEPVFIRQLQRMPGEGGEVENQSVVFVQRSGKGT